MMKIVLDSGEVIEVKAAVFRKILAFALTSFRALEKEEGKMFPQSERDAMKLIFKLQTKDTNLM